MSFCSIFSWNSKLLQEFSCNKPSYGWSIIGSQSSTVLFVHWIIIFGLFPWCQRTPNYANFLNPFRENSWTTIFEFLAFRIKARFAVTKKNSESPEEIPCTSLECCAEVGWPIIEIKTWSFVKRIMVSFVHFLLSTFIRFGAKTTRFSTNRWSFENRRGSR